MIDEGSVVSCYLYIIFLFFLFDFIRAIRQEKSSPNIERDEVPREDERYLKMITNDYPQL